MDVAVRRSRGAEKADNKSSGRKVAGSLAFAGGLGRDDSPLCTERARKAVSDVVDFISDEDSDGTAEAKAGEVETL